MSLINSASLIVTPNAYKEGTLYSVIPSDGSGDLSVTRATTATRVNSAGLVELVPYNLVQYSEQFNNTLGWLPFRTSVTANAIVSPDGTLTAENITEDTNNGTHEIAPTSAINANIGVSYAASFFFKAGTRTRCSIILDGNAFDLGGVGKAIFNLSTGAIISTSGGATATIENVGNGWYRCAISKVAANTTGFSYFQMINDSNQNIYVGNGTSFFSVWGAQLNEGTLKPYQKTETRLNIPRLDYSNGTCPSLLVEPQRTNLALWSSSFDNAYWIKTGGSVTANATTAPDGTMTADINANGVYPSVGFGNALTTHTGSIFAKANPSGASTMTLLINAFGFGDGFQCTFNLATGTFGVITNIGSGVGASAKMEDYGNGWYRCSLTGIASTSAAVLSFNPQNNCFIWGAQVELGSYPTSYIPTTSASVTRNADVISKTGISSLIGQTEGTIFCEINFDINVNTTGSSRIQLSDGTTTNWIFIGIPDGLSSNLIRMFCNSPSGTMSEFTSSPISNGVNKIAFAYKSGSFVLYVNGIQAAASSSSITIPTCNRIDLQGQTPNEAAFERINYNAAALWKTRLTNDELEQLTGTGFNTYAEMANYYNYITQ